jgi:hypothetical protein
MSSVRGGEKATTAGEGAPAVRPAAAMAPGEALATIAEIASAYTDEAALARLGLRAQATLMKVIADTARLAGSREEA